MIDITSTRQNVFSMHPPAIVYMLLYLLSCCCAFMAGYGMTGESNWLYIVAFALVITATIYATLEIEYPSQGLIRLTHSDRNLISLRNSMK
jgi:cytochrome c oxidase subunit IV